MNYNNTIAKLKNLIIRYDKSRITFKEMISHISDKDIEILIHPSLVSHDKNEISRGFSHSAGVTSGKVYFKIPDSCEDDVIYVTNRISNDHISKFKNLKRIIAQNEEVSSHATIVSRSMSLPLISNIENFVIKDNIILINSEKIEQGDFLTIDCFTGKIYKDILEIQIPKHNIVQDRFLQILRENSSLQIGGNADNVKEISASIKMQAQMIDMRTEHMFLDNNFDLFRKSLIPELSTNKNDREILFFQR